MGEWKGIQCVCCDEPIKTVEDAANHTNRTNHPVYVPFRNES